MSTDSAGPESRRSPFRVLRTCRERLAAATDEPALWAFYEDYVAARTSTARYVLGHPLAMVRAGLALLRLPRREVLLSSAHDGREMLASMTRPGVLGLRFGTLGVSVLDVPADPSTYTNGPGSSRKTLRKKSRYAVRAGITWRPVVDAAERRELLALGNEAERNHPDAQYRSEAPDNSNLLAHDHWLAAFDRDGVPLLLSVTAIDGVWAELLYFRTLGTDADHGLARYLVFTGLVEDLSRRGVEHVVGTETPVDTSNGLRHFQRITGFRLVRLTVRPDHRTAVPGAGQSAVPAPRAGQPDRSVAGSETATGAAPPAGRDPRPRQTGERRVVPSASE